MTSTNTAADGLVTQPCLPAHHMQCMPGKCVHTCKVCVVGAIIDLY